MTKILFWTIGAPHWARRKIYVSLPRCGLTQRDVPKPFRLRSIGKEGGSFGKGELDYLEISIQLGNVTFCNFFFFSESSQSSTEPLKSQVDGDPSEVYWIRTVETVATCFKKYIPRDFWTPCELCYHIVSCPIWTYLAIMHIITRIFDHTLQTEWMSRKRVKINLS